ncbi:MAG: hypothetical protein ACM3NI_12215, partial [Bacteroidota bacterium]
MADTDTSADPSLLLGLKQHLEGLRRTAHGQILYSQIERGLKKYGHADGRLELVFVSFLHALLGKYAKDPACDPATRVKARMIQQRLTLYLPDKPVAAPTVPAALAAPRAAKPSLKTESPPPPVSAASVADKPAVPPPARRSITTDLEPPLRTGLMPPIPPAPTAPPVVEAKPAPGVPAPVAASPELAPPQREKIEALEGTLAEKVTASIAADTQFGELLQNEREVLEKMESPLGDFNDLKSILVRGLNELIEERQALIE